MFLIISRNNLRHEYLHQPYMPYCRFPKILKLCLFPGLTELCYSVVYIYMSVNKRAAQILERALVTCSPSPWSPPQQLMRGGGGWWWSCPRDLSRCVREIHTHTHLLRCIKPEQQRNMDVWVRWQKREMQVSPAFYVILLIDCIERERERERTKLHLDRLDFHNHSWQKTGF